MFAGIIIGLLLGIGLALGLAMWLNRASSPFSENARPVEALPTITAKPVLPPTGTGATSTAKGDADKPRFDFYQILPGEKSEKSDKVGRTEAAAPKVVAKAEEKSRDSKAESKVDSRADAKPGAKPDIKPASGETFQLQAGAYQNQTDAENVKAKVAFAGFEAMVRPVNLADKGTLFRVRLGPYRSLDEVNRIKATLAQSGINAAVVKGSD
jgi:cell division protein FtsN